MEIPVKQIFTPLRLFREFFFYYSDRERDKVKNLYWVTRLRILATAGYITFTVYVGSSLVCFSLRSV